MSKARREKRKQTKFMKKHGLVWMTSKTGPIRYLSITYTKMLRTTP